MSSYLFVDGGYLTHRLQDFARIYSGGEPIDLDYKAYLSAEKIFYYDALPEQKDGQAEAAYKATLKAVEDHHSRLRAIPGCHVFNGRTVERGKGIQQKGVDVLLSVHMLTHVFRKNVKRVTLLAGDADFAPLVRALVMEGAYVTVQYARSSYAAELLESADVAVEIKAQEILERTMPDFMKKHPPCSIFDAAQHNEHQMKLVRKGRSQFGDAFLYQDANGFRVAAQKENPVYYRHMTYRDEKLLYAFVDDQGFKIEWK